MSANPTYTDPRSSAGILSRGQNVYSAGSYSPWAGKSTVNSQKTQGNMQAAAQQALKPKPPNSMNNIDYQRVAQWLQPTV